MPHINYKRGETRTFVIRRERVLRGSGLYWKSTDGLVHSGLHQRRNRRGRKGLAQWARLGMFIGVRNWCPCCVSDEFRPARGHSKAQKNRRLVSRMQRNADRYEIQEGLDDYNDDRAG